MDFKFSINWNSKKGEPIVKVKNHNAIMQRLLSFANLSTPMFGIDSSARFINEGYQKNADLYAVVNWRAEKAAAIPLLVEQKQGDSWVRVPDHKLQKLIDRPNEFQNGIDQRHLIFTFYDITGNSFVYGTRFENGVNEGQTQEMFILPSQGVAIKGGTLFTPPVVQNLTSFRFKLLQTILAIDITSILS